jgi:hypothetical protein
LRTSAARRSAIGGRNLTVVPYGVTCSRRTAHVLADRFISAGQTGVGLAVRTAGARAQLNVPSNPGGEAQLMES